MGYSEAKFNVRVFVPVRFNATSTQTATASAHVVTNTDIAKMPPFLRRTQVTGFKVVVVTAPNAGATTTKIALLNATNTAAVCTIGTLTAGQIGTGSVTLASSIFAAGGQPTISVVSTATASETVTQGNYDIYFEDQELYS